MIEFSRHAAVTPISGDYWQLGRDLPQATVRVRVVWPRVPHGHGAVAERLDIALKRRQKTAAARDPVTRSG